MKKKHIKVRIEQAKLLASLSSCSRRQFGALLLDPKRNVILMDGYNGGPRGASGSLCGGDVCLRDKLSVPSGQNIEISCSHAEENCICNAAAAGVASSGGWMIITGEPCKVCARLIHHAGIEKIIIVGNQYTENNGIDYLKEHKVDVEYYEEK